MNKFLFCVFIFLFEILFVSGLFAQQKEQINILNSNSLEYDKNIGEGVRRFIGDVIFEHNNATMYCDSAYLYSGQNLIYAFNHSIIYNYYSYFDILME